MKTRGIMLAAILCSGTAFAQSTTLKAEQATNVKTSTSAQAGKEGVKMNGKATVSSDTKAGAKGNGNDADAQSKAVLTKEAAAGGKLFGETGSEMKSAAGEEAQGGIDAATQAGKGIESEAGNAGNVSAQVAGDIKSTAGNTFNAGAQTTSKVKVAAGDISAQASNSISNTAGNANAGLSSTVKSTLNTSAGAGASLHKAVRIKTGPSIINTQLISNSRLLIR